MRAASLLCHPTAVKQTPDVNIPGTCLFCTHPNDLKLDRVEIIENVFCLHFPMQTVGFTFINLWKVIYDFCTWHLSYKD